MSDEMYYPSSLLRDRRIHIADGDLATCEALSVLFRLEGFQTAYSLDAGHFMTALDQRRPDIAVLNLRVGAESGLAMLRRIKAMRNTIPVFMLADYPQVEAAVMAIKLGASDVISKPIDTEHFLAGIFEALRAEALAPHVGASRRGGEVYGFAQLTPREREVLQLITNGQSNKEAGRALGISPRTVEVHRARVMEKLGARNTADLMRIVLSG
ncbi:response regulator transcription factor [Devosia aquimaris]|uniref:response regulator transcription factor n=1 Tax=Devosia aquimaris TaxID=2866214 RepID=UPI001CD0D23E|nr:LuxR C-terminal-related transcriptional regulator [Devosia sp. CJK-A8-3]